MVVFEILTPFFTSKILYFLRNEDGKQEKKSDKYICAEPFQTIQF